MVKTVSEFSLAAVFMSLLVLSAYAEIIGSGFRDSMCTGEFSLNLFMDHNRDGIQQSKSEESLSGVEVQLGLANFPSLGRDKFISDSNGVIHINALCKGVFSIEVETDSLPAGAEFEGVYENGVLVTDSRLGDGIEVNLDGGAEANAPGMRYLDIAFNSDIRGLR